MNIESFIEEAWKDHADRTEEVAARLAGAVPMVQSPVHVARFAAIVTHVYGEHLARWEAGVDLLQSLRPVALTGAESAASRAVDRSIATLRYSANAKPALANLSIEDQAAVLATSASTLAARREHGRAIDAYAAALQLAAPGLPTASPAIRALAVAGNNLAASLEEKTDRDPQETRGMVAAAEGGLKYWQAAGTWLEHERAEYRLAKSLLQAGASAQAVMAARRCVDICEANDAPAFERFFGCAVLALAERRDGNHSAFEAARLRALEQYAMIVPDEAPWCESDRRELDE
jgi:hypothetical protein